MALQTMRRVKKKNTPNAFLISHGSQSDYLFLAEHRLLNPPTLKASQTPAHKINVLTFGTSPSSFFVLIWIWNRQTYPRLTQVRNCARFSDNGMQDLWSSSKFKSPAGETQQSEQCECYSPVGDNVCHYASTNNCSVSELCKRNVSLNCFIFVSPALILPLYSDTILSPLRLFSCVFLISSSTPLNLPVAHSHSLQ